jgi:hypothetical protein
MTVPKRFAVLRFVATLLKVFAWIFLVLSILGAIGAALAGTLLPVDLLTGAVPQENLSFISTGGGILAGIFALILGLLYFLIFYALGEGINMQLAVEENTRLTAALLLRMHQEGQPEESPAAYSAGGFVGEPYE